MSVSYLDVQDEITDAVARLRGAPDKRVILVVPVGSRIGTSRINFRLLLREARSHGVSLDVVSGEAGVRALAQSAGARAFGTVAEAERQAPVPPSEQGTNGPAVLDIPEPPDPHASAGGAGTGAAAAAASAGWARTESGTFVMQPRGSTSGFDATTADTWAVPAPEVKVDRRPRRGIRAGSARLAGKLLIVAAIVAILAGVGYGAYMYLPTATIELTPETQTFGPQTFRIIADPSAAVPDAEAGTIPAETHTLHLTDSDTFQATGTQVTPVPATGTVRFTSTNTDEEVAVPLGTTVNTRDGTAFVTTQAAQIPKAQTNKPSQMDVPVQAVEGGLSGNVPVGRVTELPDPLAALFVTVTNPQPMSGGGKVTLMQITQDDYDTAVQSLTTQLRAKLTSALADPANTPTGLTIYPDTAALGTVNTDQAASDLVGKDMDTFSLAADTDGTVVAVDLEMVKSVAAKDLEDAAPAGAQTFPDTVQSTVTDTTIQGDTVVYDVAATMQQYVAPVQDALVAAIKGKTVSDARSILAPYGTVAISIWPDFVPTIPDDERRINLTIENPQFPR